MRNATYQGARALRIAARVSDGRPPNCQAKPYGIRETEDRRRKTSCFAALVSLEAVTKGTCDRVRVVTFAGELAVIANGYRYP